MTTVHLIPGPGPRLSPGRGRYARDLSCCGKHPHEVLGDLLTTDPRQVTCGVTQRVELTIPCPFWMFSDSEARETFARAMWTEILARSGFVISGDPDIIVQAHHARWDALNVTGSARLAESTDDTGQIIPVHEPEPPAPLPTPTSEEYHQRYRESVIDEVAASFSMPEPLRRYMTQVDEDESDEYNYPWSDAASWSPTSGWKGQYE